MFRLILKMAVSYPDISIKMPHPLDDSDLVAVLNTFNSQGEETRIVGGAVRNHLIGLPLSDIDLATTALPDKTIALARAQNWRTIPTGLEHGTVTILLHGKTYEITTLRHDIATDGRHAVVEFGRDFAADALRRDFTINALSMAADGTVYDITGGVADLKARRVRFIGNAKTRINEDYLRILRFFRFSATYADQFDTDALSAIVATRDGLSRLSKERIASELFKILLAPRACEALEWMSWLNILPLILGGIGNPQRLCKLMAIEHMQHIPPDPLMRLAALALFVREDAPHLRDKLRLSNESQHRMTRMAQAAAALHHHNTPPDPTALQEYLFLNGRQTALDGLVLAWCTSGAQPQNTLWIKAHKLLNHMPEPKFPFSGADLLARGLPSGPTIGLLLTKLQREWIKAGFPHDAMILKALLEKSLS